MHKVLARQFKRGTYAINKIKDSLVNVVNFYFYMKSR